MRVHRPLFRVGQIYLRRQLHDRYGGQRQGGISTPAEAPVLFLFTGAPGERYGYRDGFRRDRRHFWYTGEGQTGDMQMARGNEAIRAHRQNGKRLHVFEKQSKGLVKYVGPMQYVGHRWVNLPDVKGSKRRAVIFELELARDGKGLPSRNSKTASVRGFVRLARRLIAHERAMRRMTRELAILVRQLGGQ